MDWISKPIKFSQSGGEIIAVVKRIVTLRDLHSYIKYLSRSKTILDLTKAYCRQR